MKILARNFLGSSVINIRSGDLVDGKLRKGAGSEILERRMGINLRKLSATLKKVPYLDLDAIRMQRERVLSQDGWVGWTRRGTLGEVSKVPLPTILKDASIELPEQMEIGILQELIHMFSPLADKTIGREYRLGLDEIFGRGLPGPTWRSFAKGIMGEEALTLSRLMMVAFQIKAQGITDPKIIEAMWAIPRERFMLDGLAPLAYDSNAFPIGHDQTISSPYMVGLMTQLLALEGNENVLEVGTGSGYQAAVLGRLCRELHTVERIQKLAEKARAVLGQIGAANVTVWQGDGALGLADKKPFDRIIVTAQSPNIPEILLGQLKEDGGIMVIPVGPKGKQTMTVVVRKGESTVITEAGECYFVSLVSGLG